MLRSQGLVRQTTISQTLKADGARDSAFFSQEKLPLKPMGTFPEKAPQEQNFEGPCKVMVCVVL